MGKNLSSLSGRKGLDDNLFDALGRVAAKTGTPSREELEKLQQEFLFGKANLQGTITFYDFLKPENQGKKVYVCNGSACLTAGTQTKLRESLETKFSPDQIGEMCCLGRCHENSAFYLDGHNYSGNSISNLDDILQKKEIPTDRYQSRALGEAILTETYPDVREYYSILKEALQKTPESLLEELKISGLRGRGGAGFSMAFKLSSCRASEGDVKYIVCNADEGDPGAYSDRYIMEQRPHHLLLGMMLAGYMAGAAYGVLYIRAEYPESIAIIREALDHLKTEGITGDKIFGSDFSFRFKLISAQGAYICGEETALLSSIEGQRPEVRVRPPYPTQQGLFNMPTAVNNVETLASVPHILKNGGQKYAAIGTTKSTGTKLVSLDGFFNHPGVYEAEMGTPMRTIIDELGGGFKQPVKALHIGGPLGGIVPITKIDSLNLDFESFSSQGFLLGHASVVSIPESYPMMDYLTHLMHFAAHESCGKCFPCRLGTQRGFEMLDKARKGEYQIERQLFDDLLTTLQQGSLCAHGGGIPLPVRNALQYFYDELEVYFEPLPTFK